MKKSARFCPNCGAATQRQRREIQSEIAQQASVSGRATWAIAVIFLGSVASVLMPTDGDAFVNWKQDVGMVISALLAIFILKDGNLRASFASLGSFGNFALGAACGVITFAIAAAYVWLLPDPDPSVVVDWELSTAAILSIVVIAPLLEEWIDRGVAWQAARAIGGARFTIVVTATLFAMAHGLNGGFVIEFPHRFAGGLIFGWLRLRSGSLLPPIAAHMVNNGMAVWVG